jgi:hypothetical protein
MKLANMRLCLIQHVAMKRGVLKSLARQYRRDVRDGNAFSAACMRVNVRREGAALREGRAALAEIDRHILADYVARLAR